MFDKLHINEAVKCSAIFQAGGSVSILISKFVF